MRLVFLCGCMEPGRDGVGDYTRRLAGEIIKQGHDAAIVALHDHFIAEEIAGRQQSEEIELPVFRIPASTRSAEKFRLAKEWIAGFNPDWLSLQYVPFSFHYKGLPFGLNKQVAKLRKGAFLHVMFHELWVGEGESFRRNIQAALQKMIFRQMKSTLRPEVIHTHLPDFYARLRNLNFEPLPLPLFSNVHVQDQEEGIKADKVFRVGVFSQIGTDGSIINFLRDLHKVVSEKQMFLEVLVIGDNDRLKRFGAFLEGVDGFEKTVKYTGFLKNSAVSTAIQSCSIGLTSLPRHALGKSGSVAAFLAHGIPVAAPFTGVSDNGDPFFSRKLCQSIIINPDILSINRAIAAALIDKNEIEPSRIAERFLKDLSCPLAH